MEGNIVFISGGARSGKSTFAEQLAQRYQGDLHYIATARVTDEEMDVRIKRHQTERQCGERPWTTWECPVDIHSLAYKFHPTDIVLIDCMTILVANELFRHEGANQSEQSSSRVILSIKKGIEAIARKVQLLIIVSNEVLYDGVSNDPVVHTYQQTVGRLHQEIVKRSRYAYTVEAGVPILMKDERHI